MNVNAYLIMLVVNLLLYWFHSHLEKPTLKELNMELGVVSSGKQMSSPHSPYHINKI